MSQYPPRFALYAGVVFLSSALVLVLELLAARLIAPFVGVSLYSWTAIIGVVLAGLSLGNWLGGLWADRGATARGAGVVLFLAGIAALTVLWLLPLVAGPLQNAQLSLAASSFLLALVLFFLPAALIGVITPLLTTLALMESQRPGHIVGLMHALAALGSIVGTFATGFWLLQWLGSRDLVLATGILLMLMALPLLGGRRPLVSACLTLGVLSWTTAQYSYPDPCDHESNYFCIRVVDSSADVPHGNARSLVLDHLLHSTNHEQDAELILAPYLHLMDELITHQRRGESGGSYFFAGGGAYTLPRALLARDERARITVAELDPVVTRVATEKLHLDTRGMDILHLDARAALNRLSTSQNAAFDAVVGDVFHDIAIPHHLLTREFSARIAASLNPQGIYVMNVVDAFPDARLIKALHRTLSAEFADVQIWIDQLPREATRVTYVISARQVGPEQADRMLSRNGLRRAWYKVTEPVLAVGTPLDQIPLLTDDHAPVERLLAQLFLGEEGL
ncbi:MAG: fused MFS/spermidine synthase [Gammaproteobacteria bacterium]